MGRVGHLLTLVVVVVMGFAASCSGDDEPEPAKDAEWVSGFCQAALKLGEATASITPTPGGPRVTPEMLKAMAPAFRTFAGDLDRLSAPKGIEDYHAKMVAGAKAAADQLAKGDMTVDPFRQLEELKPPAGFQERFGPLALADSDCQAAGITFAEEPSSPGPTASASPEGGQFTAPSMDYSNPAKFLEPGPQSKLSERSIQVLRAEVLPSGIPGAAGIYAWMAKTFTSRSTGGATIGQTDVNSLIESRTLTGCHDWALVMTSALRYFGYPSVMVDAAGLQWAEDFAAGKTRSFAGHVFAEVLTNDGWMLVDCAGGRFTLGYDPKNPVIGYSGAGDPRGFYALYKGTDPASYGVTSNELLQRRMAEFAAALSTLTISPPQYDWQPFR